MSSSAMPTWTTTSFLRKIRNAAKLIFDEERRRARLVRDEPIPVFGRVGELPA
jgi:hypothetical protein